MNAPEQNYAAAIEATKSLGSWTKVQKSVWYVDSLLNAEQAAKKVYANMDSNDSLIVVDATQNTACWHNLFGDATKHLQHHWR